MTVSSEASWSDRDWTGVETAFNAGFKALDASHVKVTFIDAYGGKTALTAGVHFSAALDALGAASVTPIALPPAPATLRIYRVTPAVQETDFANLEGFDPAIHTRLHDAAAMRSAEEERDLAWAIADVELPDAGWSPVEAIVTDGDRRVKQIVDWTGGGGTKPPTGQYVGAAGWVSAIADAADIRGAPGTTGGGTGDVVGPSGGTQAMQFAFYANDGGKTIAAGAALTPAQLTGDVDNYNPANLATAFLLRHAGDAARAITGLAGGIANRPIVHVNIGAYAITLKHESASSTAANRFALGADVVLQPGDGLWTIYDATSQRWRRTNQSLGSAAFMAGGTAANQLLRLDGAGKIPAVDGSQISGLPVTLPPGHLFGLTIANNASDATNDIDIAVGRARDSGNTRDLVLAVAVTRQLDVAFGSGNGGRFDSTISDGIWYLFVIGNGTLANVGLSKSLVPTAQPNYPAGYTYRRIGAIHRASSVIRPFVQKDDRFYYVTPVDSADTTNTDARNLVPVTAPPNMIAMLRLYPTGGTGAAQDTFVQPAFETDAAGINIDAGDHATMDIVLDGSSRFAARAPTPPAGTSVLKTTCIGWIDSRGRLA